MSLLRRLQATVPFVCILVIAGAGCSKPEDSLAMDPSHKQQQPQKQQKEGAATPQAPPPDIVNLGANAPEVQQMRVEPIHEIPVPAQEVVAPAKIEVNPNRVGHSVLPAPGRILHVMVKLGDTVTQGQPVVTIESTAVAEAEAAYTQAEIAVRQADVAIAKAEADLARLADLFEHKAVAQKEVLAAQTTLALAKTTREQSVSSLDQARRKLELWGLKPHGQLQQITVTAPVAGKVMEVNVVSGEFRNEINQPLVTVADLSRVWAAADVPESEIRHFRVGGWATLALIAYPGEEFRARVTRIADAANSETRTIKVNAELENTGGRLRPEMFGSLKYAEGVAKTPWVPAGAIVRMADKDYVFVELAPGKYQLAPVELGKTFEGGFAINKGLPSGTRVVTQGSVYLKAAL